MAIVWGKLSDQQPRDSNSCRCSRQVLVFRWTESGMSLNFCRLEDRKYRTLQRVCGDVTREQRRVWSCSIAAFVLILPLLIHPAATAQVQPIRRILILNEVNPSYPATSIIYQGIQTALSNSPYHLEFYSEYFDTTFFPDPAVQQEFRDFYLRKYRNRKPD